MDPTDLLRAARELLDAVPYVLVCTFREHDVHARQVQARRDRAQWRRLGHGCA